MNRLISLFLVTYVLSMNAQVPFPLTPSFETTPSGHVATGLGIADINGDGWKDIIVANGNDIYRQHLVVYYNLGDGSFPLLPDWQSDDIDYHGHLSAGDIDNDGDVDIAVSVYLGPGGFGDPGKVKVYYNTGTELEGTPSFQSEEFYSFSCALGDADADGDLDLAVACSEPYGAIYDHGRIFYNNNGLFNTVADWTSNIQMGALDVEFGDVDRNGFLDLIFVSEETSNYVFLADNSGTIDEDWDWVSDHPDNYMNSVDFGIPCSTSSPCFVSTGNDQLGGDGKIKQFVFNIPIPQSSPPSWESNYVGYGSGILLADIDHDYNLDLLYGSWWGPLSILKGDCGFWDPVPVYESDVSSVVEAILMSDLGKYNIQAGERMIKSLAEQGVLYLEDQIIERIITVSKNNVELDRSEYTFVELKNWVSFKDRIMPGDLVSIEYEYMKDGDIVISNWDSNKGNYIYYNDNNPVGLKENDLSPASLSIRSISPQPATEYINIKLNSSDPVKINIKISNVSGKILKHFEVLIDGYAQIDVSDLPAGLYIIAISDGNSSDTQKFMITR